jgi:hypothetical protein
MLKIQFKDGSQDPVLLTTPGKTIGSGKINDIVVNEKGVNGFHADLKVEGDSVFLSDVDTQTGTFLNGEKIAGPMQLRVGDVIRIMAAELEVADAADAEEAGTIVLSGSALKKMGADGWSIVADTGPEKGQVIPISAKVLVGRALDCDLSILEPGLSRKHAELNIIDGKLVRISIVLLSLLLPRHPSVRRKAVLVQRASDFSTKTGIENDREN